MHPKAYYSTQGKTPNKVNDKIKAINIKELIKQQNIEGTISKIEMIKALLKLDYLPYFKKKEDMLGLNSESTKAQSLVDAMWVFISPNGEETVQKETFTGLLQLLMAKVTEMSDQELAQKIAEYLLRQLEQ